MTDHSCSRVELDGRRIVVELSDADLARLTATVHRRGVDGPRLVLEWIRRGVSGDTWARPGEPFSAANRMDRDVEVARNTERLFGGVLGDSDHSG
ncbi:hypothetical protein APR04_002158 [Promicromonospora umidemergens]|uniref:Ribbon-helix-helix CopG family protein n=1 Tax=Promicromonospora umidemergens TaxID=629679 RepID=A0ABP8WR53_9MICO|nr:hypothetical protein [Promicromonospora umidemergens]MCP2283255.1 hypothetical protein [Promicromonospora umidemergens]